MALAAGVVGLPLENRPHAAINTPEMTKIQTVRIPMESDFAETMASLQQDIPDLMANDAGVAFILGAYLAENGNSDLIDSE